MLPRCFRVITKLSDRHHLLPDECFAHGCFTQCHWGRNKGHFSISFSPHVIVSRFLININQLRNFIRGIQSNARKILCYIVPLCDKMKDREKERERERERERNSALKIMRIRVIFRNPINTCADFAQIFHLLSHAEIHMYAKRRIKSFLTCSCK
jgi:hypothetical protein